MKNNFQWNTDSVKKWMELIRAVLTSIAIICGGIWFMTRGENIERANLTHKLAVIKLDENKYWGHLTIDIENIGNVDINIKKLLITIKKILPLTEDANSKVKAGWSLQNEDEENILWPILHQCSIESKDFLRPREIANIYYEFEFHDSVRVVLINTKVLHPSETNTAWQYETVLSIP